MTDSPHHSPDGSFRNPWPDTRVPGGRDILRFGTERRKPARISTPARHFSGRSLNDRFRLLWCGYALEAGDRRAYFAGDTAYHPEFGEIAARHGPFDFVIIPIGAYDPRWFMRYVHVDPEEAVRIYQELAADRLWIAKFWETRRVVQT